MEGIFLSDAEYDHLASQTEHLIALVDDLPYPKVKEDFQELLKNIDMLHREALTRLFKEIIVNHSDLHHKMENDKTVNLLFSLYDLFHTDIQNGILAQEILRGHQEDKYPLWLPIGNIHDLKFYTAYKYAEEGEDILIIKTEEGVYAVKNHCGNTNLPLDGAAIDNSYLICPWHGCNYRLSDGVMEGNPLLQLKKYPVSVSDEGSIRIGLNM